MAQTTEPVGQAGQQQQQAMTAERLGEIRRQLIAPYHGVIDEWDTEDEAIRYELLAEVERLHAALAAAEETSDHWARLAGSFEGELYMARAALAAAEAREAAVMARLDVTMDVVREVADCTVLQSNHRFGEMDIRVSVGFDWIEQARALLASAAEGEGEGKK